MKKILIIIFLTLQCGILLGQTPIDSELQRALELYSVGRYNEAVEVLSGSTDSRSILLSAKSYYASGNFTNSATLSMSLLADSNLLLKSEAQVVLAMSLYQQDDHAGALNTLDQLLDSEYSNQLSIRSLATSLKKELLTSLSHRQRMESIGKIRSETTKRSLVTDFFDRYPKELATQLIQQLSRYDSKFESASFQRRIDNLDPYPKVPQNPTYVSGSIINLGILLPAFESDATNKSVSRGLYNGVLIAVDEYNRTHSDRKIQLHFIETEQLPRNSLDQVNRKLESLGIDAIIGPLYSEQVRDVSSMARRLGIPVLAPLANTFERSNEMDLVYQMNPSFESRGESTARIAYEDLNLRKIGVMAESGTQGENEARAFVQRFTDLGGEVPYLFIENFAEMGYFVGEHTPWFANNQALVDSTEFVVDTLDAVYFPFTGEVAGTLLNLTLTGLEAYSPDYYILGNEEMAYIDHSAERLRKLKLMYTGTSNLDQSTAEVQNFRFDYLNRSGVDPNTFSFLGYDLAKYYLWAIDLIGNPDDFMIFSTALEPFNGISNSIYFGPDRNNQALHLFEVTNQGSKIFDLNR